MASQQQKVKAFFDRIASQYRQRNTASTEYFSKRLQIALRQLPHPNARILDIGCGTGLLYDALIEKELGDHYTGIDISQQMLAHSQIPESQTFCGSLRAFRSQNAQQYDLIYALGFTTYLSEAEIKLFYQDLQQLLSQNGRAIISYTNRDGIDFQLREWLHNTIGHWLPNNRSLGRDFPIFASDLNTVKRQASEEKLQLTDHQWLPTQLPIFNWSLPFVTSHYWRPDFVVEFKKRQ